MRNVRLYLDTTVASAYFDARAPDRQRLTREFWNERLPAFEPVVSAIVLKEIQDTPDESKRMGMGELIVGFEALAFDEEAYALAREYVARGVFPERYESDANHVAIAVVNGVDYLASWNFRHLVKVATRREVNLVNALEGYRSIEIVAPPEV